MFRHPEVVVIPNRSLHRSSSKFVDLTTVEGPMADPPPFRRGHTTEGTKRPDQTAEPDNAMALALKRAKDKKEAEETARRAEREEAKKARIKAAAARLTQQPHDTPPPTAQSEQAMRVVESMDDAILDAAAVLQPAPKGKREGVSWTDPAVMARAAGLGAPRTVQQPQPEDSQRLPDYVPRVERPQPNDPRVRNGTLAPTPRVAERIATMQTESRETPTPAPERPLQSSGRHPWHEEVLKTGDLLQILGGRQPDQLKGDDREAYDRVMKEGTPDQIRAGRLLANLSKEELAAYYSANGRKSAATRHERYGQLSPMAIKRKREAEARGETPAMDILPKGTKSTTMRAIKGDPLWIHRFFLAAHAKGVGVAAVSTTAQLKTRWTLRDKIITGRRYPKDKPAPDLIAKLSTALERPAGYFTDPDFPVYGEGMETPPIREVGAPQAPWSPPPTDAPQPEIVDLGEMAAAMEVTVREPPRYVVVDGVKYLPTYEVEDDVPLPAPPGKTIWGFAIMKVGGSFGVPIDAKGPAALIKKIEKAADDFKAANPSAKKWTFQVGTRPGEVRCWRLS